MSANLDRKSGSTGIWAQRCGMKPQLVPVMWFLVYTRQQSLSYNYMEHWCHLRGLIEANLFILERRKEMRTKQEKKKNHSWEIHQRLPRLENFSSAVTYHLCVPNCVFKELPHIFKRSGIWWREVEGQCWVPVLGLVWQYSLWICLCLMPIQGL